MGSVNTPTTPMIGATSTQYQYPLYAGTTTNAAYEVCQHADYSYDTCDLNTISISPICWYDDQRRIWGLSTRWLLLRHVRPQHNINIPHMPVRRPTPHMGSVNTPATPTTRATSTQNQYSSYAGTTTKAAYGVCKHAGYSYDTCDLNTTSISPICRYDDQCRIWGLSTRRLLLRHVRLQHKINISHMPVRRPMPHMGSVNRPATPKTRATSTQYQYTPYAGTTTNAAYGVCKHAGYSYDTCDLNTTSISPICRYDDQRRIWGLSTRRLLLRHVRLQHKINISHMPVRRPTPHMGSVNTPATPKIRATSTQYKYTPYAGTTTNAAYGAVNTPVIPTTRVTSHSQGGTYTG
ncbi:unnamed protein product [Prunus armeniaca]